MLSTKNIILILGPAGSGKSTQAQLMSKRLGYKHIVESDLLKEEVKKGTKIGKEIHNYMIRGELIPFEKSCDLLFNKIDSSKEKNIIVDGFPREMEQAVTLEYFVFKKKHKIQALIYVDTTKKECLKRLMKRKREDDTKQAINKRLDIYHKQTLPVIERFEKKGLLIKVNGTKEVEPTNKEIIKKLKDKKII